MKPHLELIPLQPLAPTQPQNSSYQNAVAKARNSIIQQNNPKDFLANIESLEYNDYINLVAFALYHNVEEFVVSLSTYKGCSAIRKAYSRELIHLIGIEYAHVFNRNAKMAKARDAIFKKITLTDKNLCLRIIKGEFITSADLQRPDPDQKALYTVFAAANNHLDSLENLRQIHNENPENLQESLMAAAIVNGNSEILIYLLNQGFGLTTDFKLSTRYKKKSTCLLSLAAEANQFEMFKLLHIRGAKFTPVVLQEICAMGRDNFIRYSLQCDSTLFQTPDTCNYIVAAAMAGHQSTVQLLSEHTALLKIDGMVSKTLSAAMQNEPVIQDPHKNHQFYGQGVTVEEQDAFLYMVKLTHRQLVEHLFRLGTRVEDHERKTWGAIMVGLLRLRYQGPFNQCINLFPIALNQDLWTLVLFEACRIGDIPTMEFLHHQGLSLEVFDAEGNSPLFTAIEYNQLAMFQRLLQLNVRLTATNHFQETCLMIAVRTCSDPKIFELLINALKQKLSHDELTTFTNIISLKGNTALNTCALKLKVNLSLENRLQIAQSLLGLGAQVFEEIQEAGSNEVKLVSHFSDLKSQQESNVLYWLAAKTLLDFPVVPHYYYGKFDILLKVIDTSDNPDTNRIFLFLSKRAKHVKVLSLFQRTLVDSRSDDTVLNRLICEAIAIFASWTEYALPTFVNDCMQPEFNQQRLNRLVKVILSLGASKCKSVICIEVADKLSAAGNVDESQTSAQLKHCRLLALILYEASAVDDEHVKTEIITNYQLLISIQNYCIYDTFSNLFDAVDESQQQALLQVQEEKTALCQQLSCSTLEMAHSSKKLFMQAIIQGNRQLILDMLKNKTCTLLEPLDDLNRNAIQLAPSPVLGMLLEHAKQHYEQIKSPTASDIKELASICDLIPNNLFNEAHHVHISLRNRLRIFRAYNEVNTLATPNPGSVVVACQFHKPTVLRLIQHLYSQTELTPAQVTLRKNASIQIFSMQLWDPKLLECVINGRVKPHKKAFACLLLSSIPDHEHREYDFRRALLDICLISLNLAEGHSNLTNIARNEPRVLLLATLRVLMYLIKLSNRDLYQASLLPLLDKAMKATTLSEFMSECHSIKQCILENLGDFRDRFCLTSTIVAQIEQDCLWHLGQKLAAQLNESEQIQKAQQARIEFLEQTLAEQKERFNDEKKRTRPWSPRLIGPPEDEPKRVKQELDEEHLSEEDVPVKK